MKWDLVRSACWLRPMSYKNIPIGWIKNVFCFFLNFRQRKSCQLHGTEGTSRRWRTLPSDGQTSDREQRRQKAVERNLGSIRSPSISDRANRNETHQVRFCWGKYETNSMIVLISLEAWYWVFLLNFRSNF